MAVLLETSLGDIVIDLFVDEVPDSAMNFLKLCKIGYYSNSLVHFIQKDVCVQMGNPNTRELDVADLHVAHEKKLDVGDARGYSIFGILSRTQSEKERLRYIKDERHDSLLHDQFGMVGYVNFGEHNANSAPFYITTSKLPLAHMDRQHTIFGRVAEGFDVLRTMNSLVVDVSSKIPFKEVRILSTHILDDPFEDPGDLSELNWTSINPSLRRNSEGVLPKPVPTFLSRNEVDEFVRDVDSHARAVVLEVLGDLPDADARPPETVLFVCKLNPCTCDDDLAIIFSRFGKVVSCEVIRHRETRESLGYAFVEYDNQQDCERAFVKMDGCIIDDRRIRVDFSQSVAKLWNRHRRESWRQ
eukprot:ANDGO_00400.mRNA.1 Peptidyl-prolyl cis-trans isomerase CYP59